MPALQLTLDEIEADVRRVAVSPEILRELCQALESERHSIEDVSVVIRRDPGLAARVLRAANSAAARARHPVADISDAVLLLGEREISYLALAAIFARGFQEPLKAYGQTASAFWSESLLAALLTEALANEAGEPPGPAYTAGLLHAVGRFFISWHFDRWQLSKRIEGKDAAEVLRSEKSATGTDHAEVGAHVLGRWRLPAEVAAAVRWQHFPEFAGAHLRGALRLNEAVRLAAAVRAAAVGGRNLRRVLAAEELRLVEATTQHLRGMTLVLAA